MRHYNYDKVTRKYLGHAKCQLCPITKTPLFPASSTPIAPPKCGKDEFQVFKDGQWSIEIDHRKRVERDPENLILVNGLAVVASEEEKASRAQKKEEKRLKSEADSIISSLKQIAWERAWESFLSEEEKNTLLEAKKLLKS